MPRKGYGQLARGVYFSKHNIGYGKISVYAQVVGINYTLYVKIFKKPEVYITTDMQY